MKNNNYIINGILITAVILLFSLHSCNKGSDTKSQESLFYTSDSTGFHLPIAYVRTDSLFSNYKYSIDLSDGLMKFRDDKVLVLRKQEDRFKKEYTDFQEKAERNLFISRERGEQEQTRLIRMQQDLEKLMASTEMEIAVEQARITQLLHDTIIANVKLFNTPKKYEMILTNVGTDNILYADPSYDITFEVIEFLNSKYVPAAK